MQYADYISQHNAQIERQAQLVEKYNQKPVLPGNRLIWQTSTVEKYKTHSITSTDVIKALIGIGLAGLILIMAICFV